MGAGKLNIDYKEVDHLLASTGFLFPRTEKELDSFNKLYSESESELDEFSIDLDKLFKESKEEPKSKIHKFNNTLDKNTYFKRAVLAAEIASQLHEEPTFGHVKFQKLMFLCENIEGIGINYHYSKKAAGPYDNKLMHSIDYELKKQRWFEVKKVKTATGSKYSFVPLENNNGHKEYYYRYFSRFDEQVQWLIDTFRKEKTNKVELIATLYGCWMELINTNIEVNDVNLLNLFYAWSVEKSKFQEKLALEAIQWMKEKQLFPH